jgi:hypothetical protein
LASITGTLVNDAGGDHVRSLDDIPVANGFVWADINRNGQYDEGEPSDYSVSDGSYLLENVPQGEVAVRMLPPLGLIQTYPSEHFAMQYDAAAESYRLVAIDTQTGQVHALGEANDTNRNGIIKTINGEYFASGHVFDSLYKIDPLTGQQTLVGHLGQEVVGGLAYDPIMDEIYTLARPSDDGQPVAALHLYKVDREAAILIPVSDISPSINGIRFTTSLAFDWVQREIVLFDNGSDTAYAYNLKGEIRKLGKFAPADAFFNLAFDGFRFLTHRNIDNRTILFEVDPNAGTLTELLTLDSSVNVNSSDRSAANEPNVLNVDGDGSRVEKIDFLVTKLALDSAQLDISSHSMRLTSGDDILDSSGGFGDGDTVGNFCVAGGTELELQVLGVASQPLHIDLGDEADKVTVAQAVFSSWPNLNIDLGSEHDRLFIAAESELDLDGLSARLAGVDEIELQDAVPTEFHVSGNTVSNISDAQVLVARLGPEDSLRLGNDEWQSRGIDDSRGERLHALATDEALLLVQNDTMWHNPLSRLDVNADGMISPIDVLILINLINQAGSSPLHAGDPAFLNLPYVDVNADNFFSPIDILLVVNFLNLL